MQQTPSPQFSYPIAPPTQNVSTKPISHVESKVRPSTTYPIDIYAIRLRNISLVLQNYCEGIQPQPINIFTTQHTDVSRTKCPPRYLSDTSPPTNQPSDNNSPTILTFMKQMTTTHT